MLVEQRSAISSPCIPFGSCHMYVIRVMLEAPGKDLIPVEMNIINCLFGSNWGLKYMKS